MGRLEGKLGDWVKGLGKHHKSCIFMAKSLLFSKKHGFSVGNHHFPLNIIHFPKRNISIIVLLRMKSRAKAKETILSMVGWPKAAPPPLLFVLWLWPCISFQGSLLPQTTDVRKLM